MNIQLTFRDFPPSDAIRAHVESRAAKLHAHSDRLIAVKIALESPHHHHHQGHVYRVRLEMIVPGGDLVIASREETEGHTDLRTAIDHTFASAERRLREHTRQERGDVKTHAQKTRKPYDAN